MKNKFSKSLLALVVITTTFYACKKSFLEIKPQGALDQATLSSEKGINKVLISAYAMLDGVDNGLGIGGQWGSGASNFVFGSMAGGEANKGSSPGDQGPNMLNCIRHEYAPNNQALNDRWKALYEGVKRCNTVLELIASTSGISAASVANLSGQARALRAWYHFQARITFGKVCYMDEAADLALASGSIQGVTNETEIYPKIVADAKFAYENLPATQDAKARINKWAAGAIYGKILMFTGDYNTAKTVLQDVVTNGTTPLGVHYALNVNYDDNFNVDKENSPESVFDFQASAQDNAGAWNANWGDNLSQSAQIGGAGFFCPTYWFTNLFKTDVNGLPVAAPQNKQVFDTAGVDPTNHTAVALGYSLYSGNIDSRLDWTVGRNGVPFYDWGTYASSWSRNITGGPFASKKCCIRQSQVGAAHDASIWFSAGGTSLNIKLIRFSDVILLLAEAEAQVGSLTNAFNDVNIVRLRAKNTTPAPGIPVSTVPKTEPYTVVFPTKAAALAAIQLERSLELGTEGHRFFNLVRWGTAATELTAIWAYEHLIPYQSGGDLNNPLPTFTGGQQNYYAVPQQQIDLSHGFIKP
jgi:starch-binding outer membrane protein, SusD/RagB family